MTTQQPLRITFKEILESGVMGSVHLGATMEEVRKWLGDPPLETEPYPKRGSNRHAIVGWKYGCLELGYEYGRVHNWGFDFYGNNKLPRAILIEGYFPSKRTKLSSFKNYLDRENISYRDFPLYTFETQVAILIGAGASCVFTLEDDLIASLYFSVDYSNAV